MRNEHIITLYNLVFIRYVSVQLDVASFTRQTGEEIMNLNNDLISREALKEATKSFIDCDGFNPVWQIIDNVPTVDAYPFEQVQELVKLNQQFAQEIENLKRPQGEWITYKTPNDEIWQIECNSCHYTKGSKWVVFNALPPYCEKCGAEMKGGADMGGKEE